MVCLVLFKRRRGRLITSLEILVKLLEPFCNHKIGDNNKDEREELSSQVLGKTSSPWLECFDLLRRLDFLGCFEYVAIVYFYPFVQ